MSLFIVQIVAGVIAIAAIVWPALAQQQPDPTAMQKIIQSLQAQRNTAMDAAALSEARAAQLAEELQKVKADKADKADNSKPKE